MAVAGAQFEQNLELTKSLRLNLDAALVVQLVVHHRAVGNPVGAESAR